MVGEKHKRSRFLTALAVALALVVLPCTYIICIVLGIPGELAIFFAIVDAICTFIVVYSIADKHFSRSRAATKYYDTKPVSRIVDEDGYEAIIPQATEDGHDSVKRPGIDERFLDVIEYIDKEFNPPIVRDEAELENRLFSFLASKYPGRVKKDVYSRDGKIDIVLDSTYGIEMRAVISEGLLRSLIGDVAFYADRYKKTAIVLFIDRLLLPKLDLEQYTEKLDNYGAIVIIKQGMIESKKV